ncbi:endo-1,4-beta-xylanase [Rivularia sp. UHCC 0363]|uniref:endo-1,4-beta-xylanase n=1 Tax=Rivularia sp. UHCC 0363 TaxID=3110244 RepID=UPI002B2177D8|nr:endo-1,4-beta-xylanase [Rivularia sp. UHCC 0363]MEA5593106.1 endo-1,4-beta-xylanase [Rivularia sp. UHCC 0363]
MYQKIFTRRKFLLGLGAVTAMGAVVTGKDELKRQQILALDDADCECIKYPGDESLKQRAAKKKLIFGAAIRYDQLSSDTEYAQNIAKECSILLPEWGLKWHVNPKPLRPTPESFDFTAADWMLNFARTHDMQFRGHTLVWHESLPPWFENTVNHQNAKSFLEKHIQTVVGRYRGKIHSWDVVNEAIEPRDQLPNGLRKTPWLELLGEDYIDLAFRLAHEADPKAMLVYNDYGLDYDIANDEAKRNAVIQLLKRLKSKGTPIHALGIQAHLNGSETNFNPQKLKDFLAQVADLGFKILITELDVTDKELPHDIEIRDRIIAKVYNNYLKVVLEEPAVIAVITWGLSDKYTWLNEFKPREDGAPVRPLPLDLNGKRKFAWNAIAHAFDNAPTR